jgi:hypothetical protein
MSEIKMYKCEGCGTVTENRYATKDWIHFNPKATVSVSKGFYDKKQGSYKTFYKSEVEDFCSWSCFQKCVMTDEKKSN